MALQQERTPGLQLGESLQLGKLLQSADGGQRRPLGALLSAVKYNWARPGQLREEAAQWLNSQPQAVSVAVATLQGTVQGAAIGYLLGSFSQASLQQNPGVVSQNPDITKQLLALQTGGPWQQARNLAALTAVQSGLGAALKIVRGKDDVYNQMVAAFGGGAAFALASNLTPANPLQSAFTTGVAFAAFTGLITKVGEAFSGGSPEKNAEYAYAFTLLHSVGFRRYENNLKKGLLSDRTLLLWNDSALRQVGVPPGPRLLMLEHLKEYNAYYTSILKPGFAVHKGPVAQPPPPQKVL